MRRVALVLVLLLGLDALAGAAHAQRNRSRYARPTHRFEVAAHYGYVWTGSRQFQIIDEDDRLRTGDLDIANSDMWGLQLDMNVRPDAQLTLLYNRQDSELTFKTLGGPKETIDNMTVEYFQIGATGGIPQGPLLPFSLVTLGATRYSALNGIDDTWKFSIIFGLGAKYYISERLALKVQGRLPYTFFGGGVGLSFGSGGLYTTVGGTGYLQGDLSGGLAFLF
jgi:opacity protein-like surface antigen